MRFVYILSAVLCIASCAQQPHRGTIETPLYEVRNTDVIEVSRIDLTDSTTVLHIEARFTPHWWIKIVSSTFIADENGTKYPVVSAEGIELDKKFYMPDSGEAQFALTFPPMPAGVNSIDLIEGDEQGAFRIWGIRLDGKLPEIRMPKPVKLHEDETLPEIKREYGKATFKVKVLGYRSDYQKNTIYLKIYNLLSESIVRDYLSEDGTFQIEIPLVQTSSADFHFGGLQEPTTVFLEPGKTSECIINLRESCRRTSLFKDKRDEEPFIVFTGAHAALNQSFVDADMNQIYALAATMEVGDVTRLELAGYDMKQCIDRMIELAQNRIKVYYSSDLPLAVKDYYIMSECTNLLADLAKAADKLAYVQTIGQGKSREDYTATLNEYTNERNNLITVDLVDAVNMPFATYTSGYHKVKEMFMLKPVEGVLESYPFMKTAEDFLEIADAFPMMRDIRMFKPLDKEQQTKLRQLPDAIRQYIEDANADLIAQIERNKKIEGFGINETGEVTDEDLFASMIAPFRGKTILIDFWETWCGPCRYANKNMAPVKEELKDKEIVYIYIASVSSPEGTWEKMIADLKGVHYRLNERQSDYLKNAFGVEGVPTYLIVDSEGNICWKQIGFSGSETMKIELLKALGE